MSPRAASRLAWSLWVLSVALAVGGLVFYGLTYSVELDGGGSRFAEQLFTVSFVAFSTVGALIVSRRPGNAIGWAFLFAGLAWPLRDFCAGWAVYGLVAHPDSLPGSTLAAWLQAWTWVPSIALTPTFLLLLFPNGRLLSRRWLPVAVLAAASAGMLMAGAAIAPGPIDEFPTEDNPFGLAGAAWLNDTNPGWLLFPVSVVLSAVSLIVRFRRSRGDERLQLKWFTSTATLVAVALAVTLFVVATTVTEALLAVSLAGMPIAAGIAIFKHGLYEIDLIIRRTFVYGVLSALLAGSYFGIVLLLQLIFHPITGGSDLAIAGSTLAVAALFRPARGWIQGVVDRRFYRRRYDAQRTLEAFSARLRDEIDLEALGTELRRVVKETLEPRHVSLWLRVPERRE